METQFGSEAKQSPSKKDAMQKPKSVIIVERLSVTNMQSRVAIIDIVRFSNNRNLWILVLALRTFWLKEFSAPLGNSKGGRNSLRSVPPVDDGGTPRF